MITEKELRDTMMTHNLLYGHRDWKYTNITFNTLKCSKCGLVIDLNNDKELPKCNRDCDDY